MSIESERKKLLLEGLSRIITSPKARKKKLSSITMVVVDSSLYTHFSLAHLMLLLRMVFKCPAN